MKILLISEYFPKTQAGDFTGGVEARNFYLAKYLAKKHQLKIIKSSYSHTQSGNLVPRLSFIRKSIAKGIKFKPDIVEGTNFITHFIAWRISQKLKIPAVAWYPDVWENQWIKNLGWQGIFGEILERYNLTKNWRKIIAISQTVEEKLIKAGADKKKIIVIPCGVEITKCQSVRVPARLNASAFGGSKCENFTICCVARLVKYKRVADLIKTTAIIKKKYPQIQVKIIGIGPEEKRLKQISKELKLEKNVHFLGFLQKHQDVLREIKSSYIFCLPSIVEGFGIVILEAMACGVPVVLANTPVSREIAVQNGALFFSPQCSEDLAKKIKKLITDKNLYNSLVKNGLKIAKKYQWQEIVKKTAEVYESLYAH